MEFWPGIGTTIWKPRLTALQSGMWDYAGEASEAARWMARDDSRATQRDREGHRGLAHPAAGGQPAHRQGDRSRATPGCGRAGGSWGNAADRSGQRWLFRGGGSRGLVPRLTHCHPYNRHRGASQVLAPCTTIRRSADSGWAGAARCHGRRQQRCGPGGLRGGLFTGNRQGCRFTPPVRESPSPARAHRCGAGCAAPTACPSPALQSDQIPRRGHAQRPDCAACRGRR
jgi:hypothetical protein